MKVNFNLEKKYTYSIVGLLILVAGIFAVNAYQSGYNDPSIMGHDASEGGVPSGMVAMFNSACPSGWTYLSGLEGKFPRGGATYGATGGSNAHTHSYNDVISHSHSGTTDDRYLFSANTADPRVASGGSTYGVSYGEHHSHSFTTDSTGSAIGTTQSSTNVPEYLTVVFCVKD